jgi:hypothetical protein
MSASGKLLTVLAPSGDGHCNFTDAQISAAFETLVRKVGTGGRLSRRRLRQGRHFEVRPGD